MTYRIRERKRWREFLAFLKLLRGRWLAQKLYVIAGNFSPHKHPEVTGWVRRNTAISCRRTSSSAFLAAANDAGQRGESVVEQHQFGDRLGRGRARAHGDADVGELEREHVVDPSPVMATVCPRACSAWTMDCFWWCVTRPKTKRSSSWVPSGPGSSGRSRASMASPAWARPRAPRRR